MFLPEHGSVELVTLFDDNKFQSKVFYLADIFSRMNELSYPLQEKIRNQNFAMFLLLDSKIGDQETNKWLTALIDDHISNLEKKNRRLLFNI